MSRPLRIEYPGAIYHITSRGNARQKIYSDETDYQTFMKTFQEVISSYDWACYAYCLMPNHYHLVIETLHPNLSAGMRQLNGIFTQRYNYRHKKVGHLFQGRFKAILVEKENYLGELIRYVTLNPVRAKLIKMPSQWKWCSHLEVLGKSAGNKIIDIDKVLGLFGEDTFRARERYLAFLSEKLEDCRMWDKLKGGLLLGSMEFAERMSRYLKNNPKNIEIPKRERLADRPQLEEIFSDGFVSKSERNEAIYKANVDFGYSYSEIGRLLNLHYSAISKVIRNIKSKKS